MRTFFRLLLTSWKHLFRHAWLALVTWMVFVLALISVNALFIVQLLGQQALKTMESRIDIAVTFKPDTSIRLVEQARSYFLSLPVTADVAVRTSDEALEAFRGKYRLNESVSRALEHIQRNPFGPVMILRARDQAGYEQLVRELENPLYKPAIDHHSAADQGRFIQDLREIERVVRLVLSAFVALFVFIGFLLIMNMVRLSIFSFRDEIHIMRLVGASRLFIRGPFVLESLWLTLFAWATTGGLLYVGLVFGGRRFAEVAGSEAWMSVFVDWMQRYGTDLFLIQGIVLALIVMLVAYLAVGTYIRR